MRACLLAGALALTCGCTTIDPKLGGIAEYGVWRLGSGHTVDLAPYGRNVELYFEVHGPPSDRAPSAPTPVLVLHGGFGAVDVMAFQTRALAQTRRVIAVDTRAHGRSSDDGQPLHYEDFALDFLALLDALRVERVDIVGWSDGGIVALLMAERAPDRVRRVVAIGANARFDGVTQEMREMVVGMSPTNPDMASVRLLYSVFARDPDRFDSLATRLRALYLSEPTMTDDALARVFAPTLLVNGEHDAITPEHAQHMAQTMPRARLVTLPGAGHTAPLDRAADVNAAMLAFLDGPAPLALSR